MIGWLIEALFASALLLALVLLIRMPVRRLFGPHLAYALWLLPVLRMALPPVPGMWRAQVLPALPTLADPAPMTRYLVPPMNTLPAMADAGGSIGWPDLALLLWLGGALVFLVWQGLQFARFRYRVLHHGVVSDRVGSVTIVRSTAVTGPLAFGVFDRVVAMPCDFAARFDAVECDLAIRHELAHHARGDLFANWVALVMLALHWFNPAAWIAFRAFRAAQEMANDAYVLAQAGVAARHAYGCAIVKSAHGRAVSPACHLNTVSNLKGRLRMLGRQRVSRGRMMLGAAALSAIGAAGLLATASGTQAADRMRTRVEAATGVEIAALKPIAALDSIARGDHSAAPVADAVTAPAVHPEGAPRRETRTEVIRTSRHAGPIVTIVRDGVTRRYEGAAAEAYLAAHPVPPPPAPPAPARAKMPPPPPVPPAPPVAWRAGSEASVSVERARAMTPKLIERRCSDGEGGSGQVVLHRREDSRQVVILCSNRVEAIASAARARAEVARSRAHLGAVAALASLRSARAAVIANPALDDKQRGVALYGIYQAIDEMEERSSHDD